MTARTWRWFETRVLQLLYVDSRLRRVLFPPKPSRR